ncbi:hypothetical protein [Saccharothrix algeriensis]|uniref:Uncharacterized protein n=2 Tax=Saccharothrix algeriensis TaxID=173560 RepID=A0ABS2SC99_9PSEU|nr:hypothetical protein [Saccharothrix algeriensis]MBM7813574.1 hypothetical protein [Saccharothrix algeriensis]
MSAHYDDPDRTPPRGLPRIEPTGERRPARGRSSPDVVATWAAAEARHRAEREAARNRPGPDGPAGERPAGRSPDERSPGRGAADQVGRSAPERLGGHIGPRRVPDGWGVAPAVIGGEPPEAPPPPALPAAVPDGQVPDGQVPDGRAPDGRAPDGRAPGGRVPDEPARGGPAPAKRSFFGKLFNRKAR